MKKAEIKRLEIKKLRKKYFKVLIFLFSIFYSLFSAVYADDKIVSLTFHDGPNPKSTPQLLKILDEKKSAYQIFLEKE